MEEHHLDLRGGGGRTLTLCGGKWGKVKGRGGEDGMNMIRDKTIRCHLTKAEKFYIFLVVCGLGGGGGVGGGVWERPAARAPGSHTEKAIKSSSCPFRVVTSSSSPKTQQPKMNKTIKTWVSEQCSQATLRTPPPPDICLQGGHPQIPTPHTTKPTKKLVWGGHNTEGETIYIETVKERREKRKKQEILARETQQPCPL